VLPNGLTTHARVALARRVPAALPVVAVSAFVKRPEQISELLYDLKHLIGSDYEDSVCDLDEPLDRAEGVAADRPQVRPLDEVVEIRKTVAVDCSVGCVSKDGATWQPTDLELQTTPPPIVRLERARQVAEGTAVRLSRG